MVYFFIMTEESLKALYEKKGVQQVPLKDFLQQRRKRRRKSIPVPIVFKIILGTPFLLLFCFGLFFLPYIIFLIATSPAAPPQNEETTESFSWTP